MIRRASLCAAVAAVLALPRAAYAQDTTDLQALLSEHVFTTASTTAQYASVAPALSTTVTFEELQLYGLRTVAVAINFLGLGVVTSDPLTQPDVGSRGVLFAGDDGKHFLLLINGHAVNESLFGTARFDQAAGFPIDLVDHIEIVVGPGSVLYGSNAMMGVINVITKSATDYAGGHASVEVGLGPTVMASAGTGIKFKMLGAPSEVTAGVEYDQRTIQPTFSTETFPATLNGISFRVPFGGSEPPGVWGGTLSNGDTARTGSGLVRFRSGDFEVNVFASTDTRGIPYATQTQPAEFDDADSYILEQAIRADVRHQANISSLVQLTSRVYGDGYQRKSRVDAPGFLLLRSQPIVSLYNVGVARWAGIEERLNLNWLGDQSLVTMLGIDARERWASAKGDLLDAKTGAYIDATVGHFDVDSPLVAPYVQQTYSPTRWLDLNAGARLDDDSRYSPVLSPRAAVAVKPWDKGTLNLAYSQAFRAPTWGETSISNYQIAPSDNLVPEHVRSAEGSFEQRFETQRVLFGVFRTWWDNLIEPTELPPSERTRLENAFRIPSVVGTLQQYRNVASIDNYGWNAAWEGTLVDGRLRYGANLTGAYTRQTTGGVTSPLALAPEIFGNARVAYVAGGLLPAPAFAVSLLGPRPADRLSTTGALLPETSTTADMLLTLTGAVPGVSGLRYRASGEYITASHGPYTAGPDLTYEVLNGSVLPTPVFAPIQQVRLFLGLRYDFATGNAGGGRP